MSAVNQELISDADFIIIKDFIYNKTGIDLTNGKKPMVAGRIYRRLRELKLHDVSAYLEYFKSDKSQTEAEFLINAMSTNETFFFREPDHFKMLKEKILPQLANKFSELRIWSAASSSGEEAYSLAMLCADYFNGTDGWRILGSDINTDCIKSAQEGIYPINDAKNISKDYLRKYCLKGIGSQEGMFKIQKFIKDKCKFTKINLMDELKFANDFHLVFLRNVMIYFDSDTKSRLIERISKVIASGGFLFIGHSENIQSIDEKFFHHHQTVYQKK